MPPPKRPSKPLVALILGGTATVSLPLAASLLKLGAVYVRIADRFSVDPPTCYIDPIFKVLLRDPRVEYRQSNLANVEKYPSLFEPPAEGTNWHRFDVVFDLTGEMNYDKPEVIHITNTYRVAVGLASYANDLDTVHRPLAYVRLQMPFYEMKSGSSKGHGEGDKLKPDGVRGRWWHEALRGIAKLPNLNSGVVRCAAWYGPGRWDAEVIPRLVVGHVYSYLDEEMKFLYNSDLRINTVHSTDVGRAMYLTALWLMQTPRDQVLKEAGTELYFPFEKEKSSKSMSTMFRGKKTTVDAEWRSIKTVVPEEELPVVPMFNVVDDGDSTQESIAKAVADVWNVKYGFMSTTIMTLVAQFAKNDFEEMVEDVNEKHVDAWANMLSASSPPIASTPISPFLDAHSFRKTPIHLDGSRAKRVLGFKPTKPRVDVNELRKISQGFQKDKIWPALS
ncbi:uncharacterized protein CcaverHIS019_0703630 [Cutaneotrichosporon cavernicola]|uniref:NAD-dependent epimerase/dehydratase domain-containing protein n=1 Tax=Cutaneotrichosporon cavernicola TaxID=279322 RepID=A0AA48LA51_9TREE|nr:uncharacterized protein CcaverHIS019_0703630 [Cutaneotrichosporon cavernicola]BEI94782.1 hypothetical protein CcaverHIS019_0703630 [Cutaneotrichosporon cavernicola]BEJ02557.1 hypothetical protein CcaverHIS631_0703520 [Cutaneotrichosporon cavernicola]BEJ10314.1 hypothetical protein CcaverHIS641_0703490 [Cutaneotrichosporon cavernicola]